MRVEIASTVMSLIDGLTPDEQLALHEGLTSLAQAPGRLSEPPDLHRDLPYGRIFRHAYPEGGVEFRVQFQIRPDEETLYIVALGRTPL